MAWDRNRPIEEQPDPGWRFLSYILIVAGIALVVGIVAGAFA
jgi:hypothetical protein